MLIDNPEEGCIGKNIYFLFTAGTSSGSISFETDKIGRSLVREFEYKADEGEEAVESKVAHTKPVARFMQQLRSNKWNYLSSLVNKNNS